MDPEIEIRPYHTGDEHGLVKLFGRCFKRKISVEHWLWKLKSHAAAYENVRVVICGRRHVGQYVGIPYDAWVDGQRRQVIDIVDTMVDPSMRRRGVLLQMGQQAHDCWREAGVSFGYGLPNELWGSSASALGWRHLFALRWLVRILRPESLIARRLKFPALAKLTAIGTISRSLPGRPRVDPAINVRRIRAPTAELDVIADAAKPRDKITLVRSAEFVENRYLRCPTTDYQVLVARRDDVPVGYACFYLRGTQHKQGVIAEVTVRLGDSAARSTLIADVENRCLAANVATIVTLAVPGIDDYQQFRHCGFLPQRAAFSAQFVPLQPEMEDRTGRDEWQIAGGDYDVV